MHTYTTVLAEADAAARRINPTVDGAAVNAFVSGYLSAEVADLRNELTRTKERLAAAEHRLKMQPVLD